MKDLNEDFGGYEVEHEEGYVGILNVGHNQRIATFQGRQTIDFKLSQAEFLVKAGNNFQTAIQILTEIVHAENMNMGKKAKKLRFDAAKEFLKTL
jgi:hypothetical protein